MTGPEAARHLLASRLLRWVGEQSGNEIFLTGGSLRDRLLGHSTHDLDLVVRGDARATAIRLATALGGKAFSLGKPPFVTWRVVAAERQLDVWSFSGSVEEDILRRDFTVNALFWRLPRGPLLDLVGGLDDLAAGRIRVIARQNLDRDPLRVLRGLRLVATRPELRLTTEANHQLAAASPGLPRVAKERVVSELSLLVTGRNARRALLSGWRLGIFAQLFPGPTTLAGADRLAQVAGALSSLAHSYHGWLGAGARSIAPALLAAPAANFPGAWDEEIAEDALAGAGWPRRSARALARAVTLGERLAASTMRTGGEARAVAVAAGDSLPAALAWSVARSGVLDDSALAAARSLGDWTHGFLRRPPLLGGDEIARLLGLPSGPARAAAVNVLRQARATGRVRSRRAAVEFLRGWAERH